MLCVQEPEIALKRISASALSEICKHTAELAQAVVDAGAVPFLSTLIPHPDSQLKRNVINIKNNILIIILGLLLSGKYF